jgi:predicted transcriptional regulator
MSATRKPRMSTAIRFPPGLHAQLEQAAADRDLSINYLVVKAVQDFLPRLIPAEEFSLTREAAKETS